MGTWNNCGSGRTPWGTYLACEENFNGYFSSSDPGYKIPASLRRYGVKTKDWGYGWAREDERFDVSRHPNEPNRFGYVVEIDPLDDAEKADGARSPETRERGACPCRERTGGVYLGDDERGEFLYRFVSDGRYVEGGDNESLLESGKLYVAKFEDGGKRTWIELTPESTGMKSRAEVCIHTRQAASAVGATTMEARMGDGQSERKRSLLLSHQ